MTTGRRIPHRFRISLRDEDFVLNITVYVDLMYLDGDFIFHIVENDTKFGAASFSSGESTNDVREELMEILVSTYIRYPDEYLPASDPVPVCGMERPASGGCSEGERV